LFEQDLRLDEIHFKPLRVKLKAYRNGEKVALKFYYGIIDRGFPKHARCHGNQRNQQQLYNHENLELMIELEDADVLRNLQPDLLP
jgi:hypothetical protein